MTKKDAGAERQPKDELPATPVPDTQPAGGNSGGGNEPTRPWENVPTINDYILVFTKTADGAGDTFVYRWALEHKGIKIDSGALTLDIEDVYKEEDKLEDTKLKAAYKHAKRKEHLSNAKYEVGKTYTL